MFESGKTYKVHVKSGRADGPGWETWMNCKVLEEEGAVVKFDRGGKECILNTQSPFFFYAEPEDGQ